MSWDEISDSLKATLYNRSKSPFYGTFVIAWMGWNWQLLFTIFGKGNQDFVKRIELAKEYADWFDNLLWPLLTASSAFIIGNILTSLFLRMKYKFSNYRRDKIQKLDLLDEEQTAEVWKKINEKEMQVNRMLTDKIAEIDSYKTINNGLTTSKAELEKEINSLNTVISNNKDKYENMSLENEQFNIENVNLKKEIQDFISKKELNEKEFERKDEEIESLKKEIATTMQGEKNELEFSTPEDLFQGYWTNTYIGDKGNPGTEVFQIKNKNEYWTGNKHEFDVINFTEGVKKVSFIKRKKSTGDRLINSLLRINDNFLEGIENGRPIKYTKADNPKKKLLHKK